jgi:hypothetical protein
MMTFLPDQLALPLRGPVVFDGYLSTTFHATFAVEGACAKRSRVVFRILVPEGIKCVLMVDTSMSEGYLHEHELLFAHPQVLDITGVRLQRFICNTATSESKCRVGDVVDVTVYDAVMRRSSAEADDLRAERAFARSAVYPTALADVPAANAYYATIKAWYLRHYGDAPPAFTFDADDMELRAEALPRKFKDCKLKLDDDDLIDELTAFRPYAQANGEVKDLVILVGSSGSGKTTTADKFLHEAVGRPLRDPRRRRLAARFHRWVPGLDLRPRVQPVDAGFGGSAEGRVCAARPTKQLCGIHGRGRRHGLCRRRLGGYGAEVRQCVRPAFEEWLSRPARPHVQSLHDRLRAAR